MFKLLN